MKIQEHNLGDWPLESQYLKMNIGSFLTMGFDGQEKMIYGGFLMIKDHLKRYKKNLPYEDNIAEHNRIKHYL